MGHPVVEKSVCTSLSSSGEHKDGILPLGQSVNDSEKMSMAMRRHMNIAEGLIRNGNLED